MRKSIIFIILGLALTGCEKIFIGNFMEFSSRFSGVYKADYYKKNSGDIVYFDSTKAPVLIVENGDFEIKLVDGVDVIERLTNVLADKNKKMQRNETIVKYGEDFLGNKKSIRLTQLPDSTGRRGLLQTSNFVNGEYDASKDTVDIYYTRIFED
jgi:hypothetical protein